MFFPPHFTRFCTGALAALGVVGLAEGSENIALGKSYTFVPKLNPLPELQDGHEAEKLTDGKFAQSPLWSDREATMGWRATRNPMTVILDLGVVRTIGGVTVSTAGGAEARPWPGVIAIFTSDDQKTWFPAGELITKAAREGRPLPPYGRYEGRKIRTDDLHTYGRYVALMFARHEELFLDEIEVTPGEASDLSRSREGGMKGLKGQKGMQEYLNGLNLNFLAVQRRYLSDLATLAERLKDLPATEKATLAEELDTLRKEAAELEEFPLPARPYLPLGSLGERIGQLQAGIWKAEEIPPVVVWTSGLWEPLKWQESPPANPRPALEVALMRDEYRSASLNITNASREPRRFRVRFKGMPGMPDEAAPPPSWIEVQRVGWTESSWSIPMASALTPLAEKDAGSADSLTVPPGTTTQVWLTLKGPAEAGVFKGAVVVEEEKGAAVHEVPLKLTVYPYQFPAERALALGGWDYAFSEKPVRGITSQNIRPLIAHLREHFVDSPWTTRTLMPFGKFDARHEYASAGDQPDATGFHDWVKNYWPDARHYYVALGVRNKGRTAAIQGCDYDKDPEGFEARVRTWVTFWQKQILSLGLKPENVRLLLIDEPGISREKPYEDDRALKIWAEAIRKADVGMKLWLDPVYRQPWDADQEMLDAMDILCVKYHQNVSEGPRFRDYYQARAQKGQTMHVYECRSSPAQIYDPYSYFRLQAWLAWEYRAQAMFFWAFSDNGPDRNSWAMLNHRSFTPLFLDAEGVVGSKQMEAIREGIEDYQTLAMLRTTLEETQRHNPEHPAIPKARDLLAQASHRVLWESDALKEPKWFWPEPVDRTLADRYRIEALELMGQLTGKP